MSAPGRLRWAMHAFPRRFRAERSAEIEGTFHEAALAGDRHPYGARALVDVVLAGWGERARTRPPLGAYLKYRLLGGRLEPQWHAWMLDDLVGCYSLRRTAWVMAPLLMLFAGFSVASGGLMALPNPTFWLVWILAMAFAGPIDRRRILKRHGYDPKTRLWAPPVVVHWVPAPRRIQRAAPWLTGVGIALLVVTPVAMISLLFPNLAIRSVTTGSFSTERVVDHTVAFGVGALAAGVVALVVGLATHRWIAVRILVPADPAISRQGFAKLKALCESTDGLHPAYGMHPAFLDHHRVGDLEHLADWLQANEAVAVGECPPCPRDRTRRTRLGRLEHRTTCLDPGSNASLNTRPGPRW